MIRKTKDILFIKAYEEIIISNSEDISLLNDITYLKSIGLVNFAIDGRWRDENYLNKIQEYNTAIDK